MFVKKSIEEPLDTASVEAVVIAFPHTISQWQSPYPLYGPGTLERLCFSWLERLLRGNRGPLGSRTDLDRNGSVP